MANDVSGNDSQTAKSLGIDLAHFERIVSALGALRDSGKCAVAWATVGVVKFVIPPDANLGDKSIVEKVLAELTAICQALTHFLTAEEASQFLEKNTYGEAFKDATPTQHDALLQQLKRKMVLATGLLPLDF
ncbi:MAG: hypothetical protein WBL72_27065 [Thermoguttaceae bacterium]